MNGPGPSSGSASTDKNVNKVALCSAMFAGFAYVGYSVIRTAFNKKLSHNGKENEYTSQTEHRLYFRRLSQTTQTDVMLGNLDLSSSSTSTSNSGKIILKPMSVQDRIKELNLRARMFSDTMIAIQTNNNSPVRQGHRSLQVSPWNSPRILSPVDIRQLMSSHSSDNLNIGLPGTIVIASPYKKREYKYNKKFNKSPIRKQEESELNEKDIKLNNKVEHFFKDKNIDINNSNNKNNNMLFGQNLNEKEVKTLVSFLQTKNYKLLERILITISNSCTLSTNQNLFREAGILLYLNTLIEHHNENIQVAAIKTLGNLTLNEANVKELKQILPVLLKNIYLKPNTTVSSDSSSSRNSIRNRIASVSNSSSQVLPIDSDITIDNIRSRGASSPSLQSVNVANDKSTTSTNTSNDTHILKNEENNSSNIETNINESKPSSSNINNEIQSFEIEGIKGTKISRPSSRTRNLSASYSSNELQPFESDNNFRISSGPTRMSRISMRNRNNCNVSELVLLTTLICLCNIAVHNEWHEDFCPYLNSLFLHLELSSPQVQLQTLKLLINLSCNEIMIPYLLSSYSPKNYLNFFNLNSNYLNYSEELLIRHLNFLLNLIEIKYKLNINYSNLPYLDKAPSPETMYAIIFGINNKERLIKKLNLIIDNLDDNDVKYITKKILYTLNIQTDI